MSAQNVMQAGEFQSEAARRERRAAEGYGRPLNVSGTERLLSTLVGGGLAAYGLSRRSLGGLALACLGGGLIYRGVTGHCDMYEQLGINTSVRHSPMTGVRAQHGVKIEKSILIHRPPEDLYRFWRDVGNLPAVMNHLLLVDPHDDRRSHWVARGPLDTTLEWDAEIISERENEMIAWRSLDGGDVDTAGSVHFRPSAGGAGTLLTLSLKYDPPGGRTVARLAHFLGQGLEEELDEDLRHFKQLMEAGEMATAQNRPAR
jgi:uncharacterized membrane protein